MSDEPKGPYTLWCDYGYEGWCPEDFDTLAEAVERGQASHGDGCVITKPVTFHIVKSVVVTG